MNRPTILLPVLAVMLAQASSSEAGPIVTDDNLHTGWERAGIFTTGVGRTFFSEVNRDTGGNPGAYRNMGAAHGGLRSQTMTIRFFSMNTGFVFDPSLGPLTSLSVAFDGLIEAQQTPTDAVAFGVGLRQNGQVFYHGPGAVGSLLSWRHFQFNNLTAGDFVSPDPTMPTARPDFSSTGLPIEFGYFAFTSSFFTSSAEVGVDNWRLEVNPQAATTSSVPEPSSLALAVLGACGVAGRRRRRNRRAR